MSTRGVGGNREVPNLQGDVGGVTYGFAFGTSISFAAWSTGFTLEVEGEKREKSLNISWMSKGSPEPHPAQPLSRRGGDAQHLSAPSTTLHSQGC